VGGPDLDEVQRVLLAYASEQVACDWDEPAAGKKPPVRPAWMLADNPTDLAVARFNFRHLEYFPWGALTSAVANCSVPQGNPPVDMVSIIETTSLRRPPFYLRKDLHLKPELARLRTLLPISEAANVWRVPVGSPQGPPGIKRHHALDS